MVKAEDIFNKSIAIMDELSENGTITESDIAEYKHRAPYLLDMFQKEMAKSGDLYKTFEMNFIRKQNLLGDLNHMGVIKENNGTTDTYTASGAYCFYLEIDGDCTITFVEDGLPMTGKYIFNDGEETEFEGTINIEVPEGTTSFLPVKGILDANGGNVVMKISGDYYFRHNNRALSPYKFKSAKDVPDYKPWIRIKMPDDFKSKTQIISEFTNWQYEEGGNHKWEGNNELYVSFSYEGLIRIKYVPIPKKIESLDQYLEIDEITAQAGAYYLAEQFAISDMNEELASVCRRKYRELKAESTIRMPLAPLEIKDVYGLSRV